MKHIIIGFAICTVLLSIVVIRCSGPNYHYTWTVTYNGKSWVTNKVTTYHGTCYFQDKKTEAEIVIHGDWIAQENISSDQLIK